MSFPRFGGLGGGGVRRVRRLPEVELGRGNLYYVEEAYPEGGFVELSDFDIRLTPGDLPGDQRGYIVSFAGTIDPVVAGLREVSTTRGGGARVVLTDALLTAFGTGDLSLSINGNTRILSYAGSGGLWTGVAPLLLNDAATVTVSILRSGTQTGIAADGIRTVGDQRNADADTIEAGFWHVDPDTDEWRRGFGGDAGGVPAAWLPEAGLSDADVRNHEWKGLLVGVAREDAGPDWRLLTEAGQEAINAAQSFFEVTSGGATLRVTILEAGAEGAAGNAWTLNISDDPITSAGWAGGGSTEIVLRIGTSASFNNVVTAINQRAGLSGNRFRAELTAGSGSTVFPAAPRGVQNFAGGLDAVPAAELGVEIDVGGKTITLEHLTGHTLAEVLTFLNENEVDSDTTLYAVLIGGSDETASLAAAPLDRPFVQIYSEGSFPRPTEAELAALRQELEALTFADIGGMIGDAQVPASFTRDSEITRSFLLNILGLTAQELNDLFVGATVSGTGAARTITVTQADGSTITLAVPDTGDGGGVSGSADGVVSGAAFAADGTTLTLTLSTGGTVTANVPAVLRQMGVAVQLDLNPPTIPAGVTTARTYNLSIEHPANLYPAANTVQVTVEGGAPKRAAYNPALIHQVIQFELGAIEATNLNNNGRLDNGDFLNVEVRIQTGNAGTVAFTDTLRVPVASAPTAGVALTDDAVLDLAQPTRTAADRAKPLGTSPTDEDALALLSLGVGVVNNRSANYAVQASDVGNTVRLTGGTARTFTLPDIAGNVPVGSIIFFVNAATAALTLDGNGSDTIDGSTTLVIFPGESVEVQAVTSTAWALLSDTTSGEPLTWTDIPAGSLIRLGQIVVHGDAYFGCITQHLRSNTGPDGDSVNWIILSNWGGAWTDKWYPAGTFVRHAGLPYVATENVVRGDVAPNASTNTKWLALGSLPRSVVIASSNTAIPATADGDTYVHTGSSNITYTLPAASGGNAVLDGWEVVISNQGSGDLTIDGNGSDTVDGRASLVISTLGRAVRVQKVANGAWATIADTKDESGGGGTPDLRGSFDTAATPVAQDRFFFTDENQSGDPIRFVTFNNLQTALANLPTVVNVSADTAIPSTAHGDTYRVTGNTARTITLPDPDDLTVGFFVRIANGSASVSHSVAREGVGQSIEGGNDPVAVAAGEVLTLQLVNANEWEAIADTTKGGGGSTFTPTKANLYDAVKAILVHNAAVTADDADDELDIATGGAASIDDNSIAPVKAQAGTAAEKAAWRTRLGSTQVSEGSTLPAVADYNANDLRVLTADIASGISFRDVLDQSTVLTAARAGDVLMVFDIRGVKTWVRVGNMLLGSAVLRARIAAIEATAERRDVFGTIAVTPPGIPGRVFPEFLALHLANKLDARALAEIRVSLNGIPIGAVTDTGLAPFNGLATVHGEQVGGTDGEEGGVVNLVINAVNRANLANNITTQPQWVTLELRYKFEGTALDTGTPADKIDRVGFAVNNAALRGLQLPPGGTAGQVLTKSGALSGVAEWATAGAGNLRATADTAATPASGDRFFFSDEGESGDPLRYVDLNNLAAALAPTVVEAYTAAGQAAGAVNAETTVQTARITPRAATTRIRAEAICDTATRYGGSGRDARVTLRLYRGSVLVAESVVGNTHAPQTDKWHNNAALVAVDAPAATTEQTYTLRAIRHASEVTATLSQRRIILTEIL